MTKTIKALPVVDAQCTLGEGPLWDSAQNVLYWVDIEQRIVHRIDPTTNDHREWVVPKRVGTLARAADGKFILGLQGEIAEFDPATGKVSTLAPLESDIFDNRCNDGKCDPVGRFWVGTMQLETKPGRGSLYCVDDSMKVSKVLSGLTISNGMGWSPDAKHMYFIDSADHAVRQYQFSHDATVLGEERIILRFENDLPDGMCVDSEGMLWIAFWGSGRVGRYDPATGANLANVSVPAPYVSSCCLGGKDLKTLYITTARTDLTESETKDFPLSGGLFSCEVDVRGMEGNVFAFRSRH